MPVAIKHSWQEGIEGKVCTTCKQWHPLEDYSNLRQSNDGLQQRCKECLSAYMRSWYKEHRAIVAEYHRQSHAKHKDIIAVYSKKWQAEHRDRTRSYSCKYRSKHPDRVTAYNKGYYQTHRQEELARVLTYKKRNPDKVRIIDMRHKARKFGAVGEDYTTCGHIADRWLMWGNRCWICGEPATQTDHVKPLAKGGAHWPCNLRPICGHCNATKNDKWPYPTDILHPPSSLALFGAWE